MSIIQRRVLPLHPAVLLGVGLGGFVDGIVLHQILQWHHMLTSAGYPADSVRNLTINTLFDGLFHASTWVATAGGLALLHRAIRRGAAWSGKRLVGGMLIGWGASRLSPVRAELAAASCAVGRRFCASRFRALLRIRALPMPTNVQTGRQLGMSWQDLRHADLGRCPFRTPGVLRTGGTSSAR
jgi:Predicted membrane protein (DUF2243)